MVAVGRGSRSVAYKLHQATLERSRIQKDRLIVVIATAIAEDEDVPSIQTRKSPRIRKRAIVSDLLMTWVDVQDARTVCLLRPFVSFSET